VGEPDAVAHQVIRLMPAGEGAAPGDEAATTVSNPDGSFSFPRVPPGRYVLEAGNWSTTMRAVVSAIGNAAQAAQEDETTRPLTFWGRADVEVTDARVIDALDRRVDRRSRLRHGGGPGGHGTGGEPSRAGDRSGAPWTVAAGESTADT
jgi:hypothetical protein